MTAALCRMSAGETCLDMPASGSPPDRPRVPQPLWAIAVTTLLLPEEASFFIGNIRLTLARVIFIVIAPVVVWRGIEGVTGRDYRFVWSDLWVLLLALWMVLSVWQTEGAERAIVGAGVLAMDFTVPYLAARFLLSTLGQAAAFCRLLIALIAIAGLLGPVDTLAGRFVTHDLVASLTGYVKGWRIDILMRNGWLRGSGPFEHPILLGTICGSGFLLATAQSSRVRIWLLLGTGIGLAASISAGPITGTALGLILLLYAHLTPSFGGRWRLLVMLGGSLFGAFCAISSHPFGTLISHLTFDQDNSYYRLIVWQIAGDLVLNQPLFGIGMTDWPRPEWMPATVDSLWLCCAMMFGIPGSLLIFFTLSGAMSRGVEMAAAPIRRLGLALSVVLTMLIYTGFTVHYWGATWILIGLLAGVRARLGEMAGCLVHAQALCDVRAAEAGRAGTNGLQQSAGDPVAFSEFG